MSVTKQTLEERLLQINQAIEQSAANHNALLGHRAEIQHLIAKLFEEECKAKNDDEVN
jgi:hypothetical protein